MDREWVDINDNNQGTDIWRLFKNPDKGCAVLHAYIFIICKMAGQTRWFCPPSEQWQIKVCQELSVPHLATPCLYKSETEPLGNPSEIYNIKGDGNCFFRAVAYAVSGDEENHEVFRSMITSFIRNEDSVNLKGIIQNKTPDQYVTESDMESNGVWASEVEIFVAAALINATVNVYSKFGGKFKWLEFKPTDIPRKDEAKKSCIPGCREEIYLYHKAGSHYDIVVSTKNPESDERQTSENKDEHVSYCISVKVPFFGFL